MNEEQRAIEDIASKILAGKDEWVFVDLDGYQVTTTTVFIILNTWRGGFVSLWLSRPRLTNLATLSSSSQRTGGKNW